MTTHLIFSEMFKPLSKMYYFFASDHNIINDSPIDNNSYLMQIFYL